MATDFVHPEFLDGQYRPIPGFPKYLARDDGEIISLQKKRPRVLKRRPHPTGYVMVTLCDDEGNQHTTVAHRPIALAFHENPDNLPCVRHLDGDKQNNRPKNLAWGTYQQNEEDKLRHGRRYFNGDGKMKLTPPMRLAIRGLADMGLHPEAIAPRFDVARTTIVRLLSGETWKKDHP